MYSQHKATIMSTMTYQQFLLHIHGAPYTNVHKSDNQHMYLCSSHTPCHIYCFHTSRVNILPGLSQKAFTLPSWCSSSCIICIIIWYENISVRLSFLLTPVNLTINACHKANSLHLIQESSTQHNLLLPSFIRKHREKPSRTTSRFSSIFHLKATRKNLTRNTSWTKPCPVNQTRSDMPHNHESISSTTPQEHGGLSSCRHNRQWH